MVVTVTDRGRLTIPKGIRDRLGIEAGTKLDFEPQPDGAIQIRVLSRGAASLYGLLRRRGATARTVEEIDEGIGEAVVVRMMRTRA